MHSTMSFARAAAPRLARALLPALLLLATGHWAAPVSAQEADSVKIRKFRSIEWIRGPGEGQLGGFAKIHLPAGYRFTGAAGTRTFMELNENPAAEGEVGLLLPEHDGGDWFAVFKFESIGYVKDDDKDKLDAAKLLESMRQGTIESNKERAKMGWTQVDVVGWSVMPAYNPTTHNLEWGIIGQTRPDTGSATQVLNHSIRLLGRDGVMSCGIVASPAEMPKALAEFRTLLAGYEYLPGKRYAEFRSGDKIAAVGLAGLIVGGAAVAAAKSGLLAKLFKPLLVVLFGFFAAIGRGIKSFFAKLFGRNDENMS